MAQTPTRVQELPSISFQQLKLLLSVKQPIATIKAVHTGANAAKAPGDDAGGLEAVICLAKSARVMLSSNLWVDMGLVNGAMGAICYHSAYSSGPTFHDGTVPITPIHRSWSSSGVQCSRLQLPLKLA